MKAKELIEKYVKKDLRENVAVFAISKTTKETHWFHVHLDEDIPLDNDYYTTIAIKPN